MTEILRFILLHSDLVKLITEALGVGVKKRDLIDVIKKEMTIVSNRQMRRELS